MGIFFSLCNAQLPQTTLSHNLTQGIVNFLRWIGHRCSNSSIILRHAGEMNGTSTGRTFKIREVLINYCPGNFTCSIGTEVGKNHTIPSLNASIYAFNSEGNDELIGHPSCIGGLNTSSSGNSSFTLALHHSGIGLSQTLPALITVHSIVATTHSSNFTHTDCRHGLLQLLHIGQSALGRNIATI